MGNAITVESELECEMGSTPFPLMPDQFSVMLDYMPAASVNAAEIFPNFGQCSVWPSLTFGAVTDCIPMIVEPEFLIGSLVTIWNGERASVANDIYFCSLGVIQVTGGSLYDIG